MKVIGIDPGISGAIAMFDGKKLVVHDMPTVLHVGAKKNRNELNLSALADLFIFGFTGADHAYIERVSAMPGQGVTSMFNFGDSYGAIKMGIACISVPYTLISPAKWKSELGLAGQKKDASRSRAVQLFPNNADDFKLVKHDGRAEAALLAWYGYQILTVGKVKQP